jgi:hypothetical protein
VIVAADEHGSCFTGRYSVEVVVKKLLALVAAALCMAACSDSSTGPSAASKVAPNQGRRDDVTCRSGYIVAFDENGNPYCVATDGAFNGSAGAPTGAASVPATPHG